MGHYLNADAIKSLDSNPIDLKSFIKQMID